MVFFYDNLDIKVPIKLKDFWQKKPQLRPQLRQKASQYKVLLLKLLRASRGYLRPLVISAVILFAFILAGWCFLEEPALFSSDDIQPESKNLLGSIYAGILGGPDESDEGIIVSQDQPPAIDFSQDDYLEDEDFNLLQDNTLLALTSPDLPLGFDRFRKSILTYTVQAGDIPGLVAHSFGINVNSLLWANNLRDGDIIRPGDKLIILPINGVRIKIKSGNTVQGLAKKYKGEVDEIIAFNDLSEDGALTAGQYLIIPGGEMPRAVQPTYYAPKYASSYQRAGWLIMPTSGRVWGRLHGYNAVDIANTCGTAVYAAAAGTVSKAKGYGWNGGYGKYVKISHGRGLATLYAHLSRLAVSGGQTVKQGQFIGYMGSTGRSTGCHLHFEVHGAKNPFVRR